ncbi:acyltransferase family protein [Paenibacillus lentus]|uniref:acyltransferase family protein n=1 Tax=Paenibacillus lentus TaxID=1338368 RepID=UPI00365F136C
MQEVRLYYIDWLRVLVILSLIPYHAALTYTEIGSTYIKTTIYDSRVLPFLAIKSPLASFFMVLLFFVSGVAAYYSFHRRGRAVYIKERITKIGIPFLLGTVLLCPVQAYFKARYEGYSGNIVHFASEFFSAKFIHYLAYAHLWFLLYLFIFTFVSVPLFTKWAGDETKLKKISSYLSRGNKILIPIFGLVWVEILLRPFFFGQQNFVLDWANNIVYFSVFIFGFIFASDDRLQQRVFQLAGASKILFVILMLLYIMIEYLHMTQGAMGKYLMPVWILTKGIYECAAVIFFVTLGKKFFDRASPILRYLNQASFTYYLVHFIPISFLSYYLAAKDIHIYVKYLIVVLFSYLFVWMVYEGIRRLKSVLANSLGKQKQKYMKL